ncbi:30S ribosome-binding factor RbfA [Oenococcus kitaharae]|uniref:Ribosome-binding factor A n=1 Tax=Oenococcus kitaharae DSM 17330 TaxID=1045004 RepID=G9WIE8_9LACO|nr:30S ribosome-binding factor RbfA [Oenococcus kitaharae]EHN58960.1 Ribosome-binding factor A [Oenococcus kitaharae DSM 17330]OEY81728.1 ribosome-binding factor A [Oenococcus kitaharae]OEY83959.1 ribosome-binding factor A [Oenococcus kitaharae]OEY85685.1 ribosome-binding factor A [Oenococcus kitaharae]
MPKREKSPRLLRVEGTIQRDLGQILVKQVSDPRLDDVTITGIDMTADFSIAYVYWTIYSDLASSGQKAAAGLEAAKGLIKRELAKKMTTFKIPDLIFKRDKAIEYGDHIEQLIAKLNKQSK